MRAFESVWMYVHENTRRCIWGLVALCIIVAAVASYFVYYNYQDKKIQYQLAGGIRAMDAYSLTKAQADIDKAEGIFQKIAVETNGNPRYISKLYLANISMVRGKRDEALKMYQDVSQNSSNDALTYLADKTIKGMEKK